MVQLVPLFLFLAFSIGVADGYRSMSNVEDVYDVILKDGGDKHFDVMRNLVRGIIVHDVLSSKVSFYEWKNIQTLSRRDYARPRESFGCVLLGWYCRETISQP